MRDRSAVIFDQARDLALKLDSSRLLAYWDQVSELEGLSRVQDQVELILVVRGERGRAKAEQVSGRIVVVPRAELTRQAQISLGVLSASALGFCQSGDVLVCLAGPCGEGEVDTIQVVKVEENGTIPCPGCHGPHMPDISAEVFNAVLSLAVELAQEGREGRPIGTTFVLGDHEKVMQFSRQAVLNPFVGYPEEKLSILDQEMKETVREFSSLDGAFIIRSDGVLKAAGRYLSAASSDLELPQGMGARHASAAAITALTEAVAMVISESSGTVTVFFKGKIAASLEKAGPRAVRASGG